MGNRGRLRRETRFLQRRLTMYRQLVCLFDESSRPLLKMGAKSDLLADVYYQQRLARLVKKSEDKPQSPSCCEFLRELNAKTNYYR